jgi:hypothetical protein
MQLAVLKGDLAAEFVGMYCLQQIKEFDHVWDTEENYRDGITLMLDCLEEYGSCKPCTGRLWILELLSSRDWQNNIMLFGHVSLKLNKSYT